MSRSQPERRRVPIIRFEVNGEARVSRVGSHEIKNRYGNHAVLLRVPPTESPSAAAASPANTREMSTTAADAAQKILGAEMHDFTICAVDARGRFLIEENASYVTGALRSVPEAEAVCNAQRDIYEAVKRRMPQRRRKTNPQTSFYATFVGAFLTTFACVCVGDACREWRAMPASEKRKRSVDVLIQLVKNAGNYVVKSPAPN